mmetsp:Transcript_51125/g.91842  ORF Transcript_51125/g.91842 Transcript_51125/m.91842 type:complete len:289 (+) Transcript_51125:796-1662(+)
MIGILLCLLDLLDSLQIRSQELKITFKTSQLCPEFFLSISKLGLWDAYCRFSCLLWKLREVNVDFFQEGLFCRRGRRPTLLSHCCHQFLERCFSATARDRQLYALEHTLPQELCPSICRCADLCCETCKLALHLCRGSLSFFEFLSEPGHSLLFVLFLLLLLLQSLCKLVQTSLKCLGLSTKPTILLVQGVNLSLTCSSCRCWISSHPFLDALLDHGKLSLQALHLLVHLALTKECSLLVAPKFALHALHIFDTHSSAELFKVDGDQGAKMSFQILMPFSKGCLLLAK